MSKIEQLAQLGSKKKKKKKKKIEKIEKMGRRVMQNEKSTLRGLIFKSAVISQRLNGSNLYSGNY